jgi:hypothetical protein
MVCCVCGAIRGRFPAGYLGTRSARAPDTGRSVGCLGTWHRSRGCLGRGRATTRTRAWRGLRIHSGRGVVGRCTRSGSVGSRRAGASASAATWSSGRVVRHFCYQVGWRGCFAGGLSLRGRDVAPRTGSWPGSFGSAIHCRRSRHRCRRRLTRHLSVLSRRILAPRAAASYWSFLIFWHLGLLKRYGTARNRRPLIPPYPASKNRG